MNKILAAALAALLLSSSAGYSGTITSLAIQVGQTVHVTVYDQNNNVVPPASLTWSPTGTPTIATGTPDSTGFNFQGTSVGSTTATITYAAPVGVTPASVATTLPVAVTSAPVTSLRVSSP